MKRNRAVLVAILLLFSSLARAADRELDAVTTAIERAYGIKRTHLPWVARFAAKPAMLGSGVRMSFEVFEDQALPAGAMDLGEVTAIALGSQWRPFVRSESRRHGELTVIYVRPEGKHLLMMIVAAERDETSVVKLQLDTNIAQEWLEEPVEMGKDNGRRR